MSATAGRIFVTASIAIMIVATAAQAMAQWTVPLSDPGNPAMFADWDRDATDYSPQRPHFGPLAVPPPSSPGPSKMIVIPDARPKSYAPNVLILPRSMRVGN